MPACVNSVAIAEAVMCDTAWFLGCRTQIGSTFLQLKFVIDRDGVLENKSVELTLPQFYDFLSEMEKAKTFVEYLGSS